MDVVRSLWCKTFHRIYWEVTDYGEFNLDLRSVRRMRCRKCGRKWAERK